MPYKVTFVSGLFRGEFERERSNRVLQIMLNALCDIDTLYLADFPTTPRLYDSGVFYKREKLGVEDWQDVATTLSKGHGDCEDLATWRAAELRVRDGIQAQPMFTWRKLPSGVTLYHIVVRYPDGRIEDPSRKLGMLEPENEELWLTEVRSLPVSRRWVCSALR